jgi:hypothetical protein
MGTDRDARIGRIGTGREIAGEMSRRRGGLIIGDAPTPTVSIRRGSKQKDFVTKHDDKIFDAPRRDFLALWTRHDAPRHVLDRFLARLKVPSPRCTEYWVSKCVWSLEILRSETFFGRLYQARTLILTISGSPYKRVHYAFNNRALELQIWEDGGVYRRNLPRESAGREADGQAVVFTPLRGRILLCFRRSSRNICLLRCIIFSDRAVVVKSLAGGKMHRRALGLPHNI